MPARKRSEYHTLTEREQQCWDLREQGMTHMQISNELGIALGTVYKRLEKARQRIASQQAIERYQKATHDAIERTTPDVHPPGTSAEVCQDPLPKREV